MEEWVAHYGGFDYRDIGRQQGVHRALEFVRLEVARKVECGHLAECVYAGVGAAGTIHSHVAREDLSERGFKSRLNRILSDLQLPTRIVGAVVLELDADSHRGKELCESLQIITSRPDSTMY